MTENPYINICPLVEKVLIAMGSEDRIEILNQILFEDGELTAGEDLKLRRLPSIHSDNLNHLLVLKEGCNSCERCFLSRRNN